MNQENQEQLASINQQISSEVCANLTKTLAAIRTEILNVQERGNADKAKARLATTAASWLESMQTLLSSIHWPRKLTKDGKVIANILAGLTQGAEDADVPFDMLHADCKLAADKLKTLISRLPAAMAPKKSSKAPSLEEVPYDYEVGEGSDIIGDFDASALTRHAELISRVPGINNIHNAPTSVVLTLPVVVEFSSYRTPNVFTAQGFDVSDIGGHLCFEDQMIVAINVARLGESVLEYTEETLAKYARQGMSLAYESPFYYDNHQWRLFWLIPTPALNAWLKTSTVPTRVGLAFANRDKPVNPTFLRNLKRREERKSNRAA